MTRTLPTPTTPAPPGRADPPDLPGPRLLERARPYTLSLFRAVTGLLFACHGAASLFGVLGGAPGTGGGTVAAGTWPGWYAAVIQLVGGSLVMLGAVTRTSALIGSGSMAYAYFEAHQGLALWPLENGGELSALFCWAFLALAVTGPGTASVDRLIARRRARGQAIRP